MRFWACCRSALQAFIFSTSPAPLRVARQEQVQRDGGIVQPPDGVDARADAEADRLRRQGLGGVDPRPVQQGAQADLARPRQRLQAERRENPILALQRHHVGDRAAGDQVQELLDVGVLVFRLDQAHDGLHGLEGDADAGEGRERVGGVAAVRVDHGVGVGQGLARLMVVGDDDRQPQAVGMGDGLAGLDAAVGRDDQRRAPAPSPSGWPRP